MKFFVNCNTIEEVKKRYKDLAKQFHPDRGGDTATMQAINSEYPQAIRAAAAGKGMTSEETENAILESEEYAQAINKIINLQGIKIELVGCWLWVTGETKQHRIILKEAKFIWPCKKSDISAWFFRTDEYKTRNKKSMTVDQIRAKYGSQTISGSNYRFIAK